MKSLSIFKNKKITVLGLGLLGRGVGDVEFLARSGADLTVTDLKTEEDLRPSLEKLKGFSNIEFVLGGHRLRDFQNKDFVLKAAGVPLDSPFVAEARKNKIPVEMSTSLFAKLSPATIVGVTGTRGKSTVTQMIFEILKKAGKNAFLGGNVKGTSTLAHLPDSAPDEIAVLELDSWQLQGFGEEGVSPKVSVFTNFFADHLDYYGGDMERYFEDKAEIFKHQKEGDVLVLGEQVLERVQEKFPEAASRAVVARAQDLPEDWAMKIPGEHNRYNAACAVGSARALSISDDYIREALEEFSGVEGRLELIRELGGVKIYNDTTATTPEATLAALRALANQQPTTNNQQQNIVLILGGSDKGLDMSKLLESLPEFCKSVITLPGTGTEKLTNNLQPKTYNLVESGDFEGAVKKAISEAEEGDIILFSPAFASFGMFKNEFDRGEQFKNIVSKL